MGVLSKPAAQVAYWVVATVCTIGAAVTGAVIGQGSSPELTDEGGATAASSGARILYALVGGALGGGAVLALFAGVWLLLWARSRSSHQPDVSGESTADMGELFRDEAGEEVGRDLGRRDGGGD